MIDIVRTLLLEIDRATNETDRARLVGRLATYYIRMGEAEKARETIDLVRNRFGKLGDAETAAWLCLAEGLIAFHTNPGTNVFDRFRRAYAITRIIPRSEIGGLSAAWLAHMEFSFGSFRGFCGLVSEALDNCSAGHSAVLCRAATSIADAFIYLGDDESSKRWYQRARVMATRERDTMSFATIAHNVVAVVVRRQRMSELSAGLVSPMTALVPIMLESSQTLDRVVGLTFLDQYEIYLRIQYHIVNQRYQAALDIIKQIKDNWSKRVPERMFLQTCADELLCQAESGNFAHEQDMSSIIDSDGFDRIDNDDRALLCWTAAKISQLAGKFDAADEHFVRANVYFKAHESDVDQLALDLEQSNLKSNDRTDLYGDE